MADDIPSKILDAASVWVERLKRGLSASEERALADWLGNDPVRHAALRRAELAWDRSSETNRRSVGLGPELAKAPFHLRSGPRIAAAVIAGTFVAGMLSISLVPRLTGWSAVQPASAELLSTHVGEIMRIGLDTGTDVVLDTASELEAAGPKKDRHLVLTRGRARFATRAGGIAPLMVRVGSWTVAADEAVFDVDLIASTPRVRVKEGVVRVTPPSTSGTTLRSGEAISGPKPNATPTPVVVDNWPSGVLTLQQTRVSEAIAAINRYNDRKIVLGDTAIGEMRVTGGFRVRDPLGLARAVAALYGLLVDQLNPSEIRLIRP